MKRLGSIRKFFGTFFVRTQERGVKVPGMITLYLPDNRVIRLHIETLLQTRSGRLHSLAVLKVSEIISALRSLPCTETDPELNGDLLEQTEAVFSTRELEPEPDVVDEEEDMSDAVLPQPKHEETVHEEPIMMTRDEAARTYGRAGAAGLLSQAQQARLKSRAHRRS